MNNKLEVKIKFISHILVYLANQVYSFGHFVMRFEVKIGFYLVVKNNEEKLKHEKVGYR